MDVDLTLTKFQQRKFIQKYKKFDLKFKKDPKFRNSNVRAMLLIYHKFAMVSNDRDQHMTSRQFVKFCQSFFNIVDVYHIDAIITAVAPHSKHSIPPDAFVKLLTTWLSGSLEDKIDLCFKVYDYHGNGYLTMAQVKRFCRNMICGESLEEIDYLVKDYVDLIFRKMDKDRDGKISFKDYFETVKENPCLLQFMGIIIPNASVLKELIAV